MKIQNPQLQQMLAAEYVLGTLTGRARKRFEFLVKQYPALRREVTYWENRLIGLASNIQPEAPRDIVWTAIDRQINARTVTAIAKEPRYNLWRAWAIAATLSSVFLGYHLQQQLSAGPQIVEVPKIVTVKVPVMQPMPYVAVLQPKGDSRYLLSLSPERGLIKAVVMGEAPVDYKNHSVQLWVIDDAGTPHSLGVMPESGEGEMPMPKDMPMPSKPMLALSMEPKGGTTSALPTGPVLTAAPAFKAL